MITFGEDNVTVHLEWSPQANVSYDVSVSPHTVDIELFTTTRLQLTVVYNTLYNISTLAVLCGQTHATTLTELYFGEFP